MAGGRDRSARLVVRRGDIVLIVAPGELGKPRPAVVVQADELGAATTAVIVCPMSSEAGQAARLRPIIEPTQVNGIRLQSQIMTDKITALPRRRVHRVIGRLDGEARERLDRALLVVLGLAR
jgi:mRNA interferase MazF